MKRTTDLFHVNLKFEDQFSGSTVIKPATISGQTYNNIERQIKDGYTFKYFDKAQQIAYDYKVIGIEQQ